MIYNDNYFKEELKKSYLDSKAGGWKLILICLLISLFSIAVNSFFVMMADTVIGDVFPALCSSSFYAVVNIMNVLILVFFVVYLGQNFKTATFAEINDNRWYMLIKSGYKNDYIIFIKGITTIIMIVVIYSVSFIASFMLSSLLRKTIVLASVAPVFVTGLLQLAALTTVIMTYSLFVKNKGTHILSSLGALAVMLAVAAVTGFSAKTRVSTGMRFDTLFKGGTSVYIYFLSAAIVVNVLVSVLIAKKKSRYYHTKGGRVGSVVVVDYKTNSAKKVDTEKNGSGGRLVKRFVVALFVSVFALGILANIALIIMGASSTGKEYKIFGYTPYVFGSETMSGDIEKNDFVVFGAYNGSGELKVGDVILYKGASGDTQIKKIVEITDGGYAADIANYPAGAETGKFRENVAASEIKGVMSYRSRWLGAWFVFNNSISGKIFTLLIPLLILAFYDKILRLLRALGKQLGL